MQASAPMTIAQLAFVIAVLAFMCGADVLERRKYAAYKDTVLFFYADWCSHCTRFKPEWARFQSQAKQKQPGMQLVALESSQPSQAGALFDVSSFPTIVYVDRAGRRHDFKGRRSSEGVSAFVDQLR